MKYVSMIFATLISCAGINAMVPDVTKWQEICRNPEEKKKLVTLYKDFCRKRIKNNFGWVAGSLVPFVSKSVRKNIAPATLFGLFAGRQTYLLGRNTYRNSFTVQKDLSYLNNDVLEQLGNPKTHQREDESFYVFSTVKYTDKYPKTFLRRDGPDCVLNYLEVNDVDGVEKALSGNYKDQLKFYGGYYRDSVLAGFLIHSRNRFLQSSWIVEKELQSMTQRIKNMITNEVE